LVIKINTMVKQKPTSKAISTVALSIAAVVGVSCTPDEKTELQSSQEELTESSEKLEETLDVMLEDIGNQEGEKPDPEDAESFEEEAVTTSAPRLRHIRNHLLMFQ